MRSLIAALAFVGALLVAPWAQAQVLHPISDAEIRALAYAGCTEAGTEPILGEYLVQYSIYMRGIDNRREWGNWNLVSVTSKRGQYNGVEWRRPCGHEQMRRSLQIANDIVDTVFVPGPWKDIRHFMAPCYSTPGGIGGFKDRVFVGFYGGHDFYRDARPGERGHALSCAESRWLRALSRRAPYSGQVQ